MNNSIAETLAPILATIEAAESAGRHDAVAIWRKALSEAPTAASGTMRAWMSARDGMTVDTFQWGNDGRNPWAPGPRTIDASRAGSVTLDGSTRYYAGMRVIGASDAALLVRDDWQSVLYIVSAA